MMRWRMSGRRIGGNGSETSSKTIVSFMPAKSFDGSGSSSIGFSIESRMAPSGSSSGLSGSAG